MLLWSFSTSMMIALWIIGVARNVAQSDAVSCSCDDRLEIAWVCCGKVTISPFVVDVPSSSQSIRFAPNFPGLKWMIMLNWDRNSDHLCSLASGEEFSSHKILQIFVVSDNINWSSTTFQILVPMLECFKDCK